MKEKICLLVSFIVLVVLHLVSLLVFLAGYFPTKNAEIGFGHSIEHILPSNLTITCDTEASRKEIRVVLFIIDALRADFVLDEKGSQMKFVRTSIDDGRIAKAYKAHVQSPTVTMPRIKALTAGIVPSFADFALNLVSSEFVGDNLMRQLSASSKTAIFFGDETWLKLFPNHFKRSDGTTSFLVTDFYEVDNNVTRNLGKEAKINDWNLMILHYLGLDHIGHYCGPFCFNLINPKLKEMDGIIENLFNDLRQTSSDFVIVVVGDHGMSDAGSHGGASASETTVPMVFLSPLFNDQPKSFLSSDSQNVQQIDLTPTLAALLDVPTPCNSFGVLLDVVEDLFGNAKCRLIVHQRNNAEQLFKLYIGNKEAENEHHLLEKLVQTSQSWLYSSIETNTPEELTHIINGFRTFSERIQGKLLNTLVDYNVEFLIYGLIGCWLAFFGIFRVAIKVLNFNLKCASFNVWPAVFFISIHVSSFLSTSFIEEEHQTWYFLSVSLFITLLWSNVKRRDFKVVACISSALILHRICREWNRTGDKWRHLEDIGDLLSKPQYFSLLVAFSCVSLIFCWFLSVAKVEKFWEKIVCCIGFCCVVLYRLEKEHFGNSGLWPARCVFLISTFMLKLDVGTAVTLISLVLIRFQNVPLIALILILTRLLARTVDKLQPLEKFLPTYLILMSSYFYLGNSNSVGTIDIACGYIGLTSYTPSLVGALTLIHLYCGPLLVAFNCKIDAPVAFCLFLSTAKCFVLNVFLLIAFFQRYHLFVWSVFAPKFLFECAHTMVSLIISVFIFLLCKFPSNTEA